MRLGLDQIMAVDDCDVVDFEVPEWGGVIGLKPLSIGDREKCEKASMSDGSTNNHAMAMMVSLSVVDEKGEQMFTDAKVNDLKKKKAEIIARIFKKCLEINTPDVDEEGNG